MYNELVSVTEQLSLADPFLRCSEEGSRTNLFV
jgi:hypothetical protein